MKTTIVILAAGLLVGCGKPHPATESLSAQGERVFHQAVTNEVVGFRRVIDWSFHDQSGAPTNWSASATVEFMNRVGGIDRTNLPFRFTWYVSDVDGSTNIFCHIDDGEIYRRTMRSLGADVK